MITETLIKSISYHCQSYWAVHSLLSAASVQSERLQESAEHRGAPTSTNSRLDLQEFVHHQLPSLQSHNYTAVRKYVHIKDEICFFFLLKYFLLFQHNRLCWHIFHTSRYTNKTKKMTDLQCTNVQYLPLRFSLWCILYYLLKLKFEWK